MDKQKYVRTRIIRRLRTRRSHITTDMLALLTVVASVLAIGFGFASGRSQIWDWLTAIGSVGATLWSIRMIYATRKAEQEANELEKKVARMQSEPTSDSAGREKDLVGVRVEQQRPSNEKGNGLPAQAALSVSYLIAEEQRLGLTVLILAAAALISATVHSYFEIVPFAWFAFVGGGMAVAGLVQKALLRYRVEKGYFGLNPYEARQLIKFLRDNADDIDFTDGDGGLRKPLLPTAQSAAVSGRGVSEQWGGVAS